MQTLGGAIVVGTLLQVAMVVSGHFAPTAQEAGLFPIAGTLIGIVTGWLAGAGTGRSSVATAGRGAVAAGLAGILGSLVSTALGDVPLANVGIAGGSTAIVGTLAAMVRRARAART